MERSGSINLSVFQPTDILEYYTLVYFWNTHTLRTKFLVLLVFDIEVRMQYLHFFTVLAFFVTKVFSFQVDGKDAGIDYFHGKALRNKAEMTQGPAHRQIVPTSSNLGPLGFLTISNFLFSGSCSGTPTTATVEATGVCIVSGTQSLAIIVLQSTANSISYNSTLYSDTTCTTVQMATVISKLNLGCIQLDTISSSFSYSTTMPSQNSFGAGEFVGYVSWKSLILIITIAA